MPVKKPDEQQHSNPNNALVDSQFIRGGRRVVDDRAGLYALVDKADQLKENVTIVRVITDDLHGGAATNLLLIDVAQIGSATGWQLENPGYGGQVIPPTYAPAKLELEQTATVYGEVGEPVANSLEAIFTQGDAGPLMQLVIRKDGVALGLASTVSPVTRNSNLVRELGVVTYRAFADYAAGPRKLVLPINTPDIRPELVGSPDAPQAAQAGMASNPVTLVNSYRVFCGPSEVITTSAQVRALLYSKLTSSDEKLIMHSGTEAIRFYIILPPGFVLTSIIDLDNCHAEYLRNYEEVGKLMVDDAGGAPVEYTMYCYSQVVPYNYNTRHVVYYEEV